MDPNNLSQGPIQNSSQQQTVLSTGPSHIQPGLWEKAKAGLSEKHKAWVAEATGNDPSVRDVVDDILTLTEKMQKKCEKSKHKTTHLCGREISIGDAVTKTIIWLNKFKAVGDIAIQYDPAHAALPWAAARFFLQAATANEERMAASSAVMEGVTRIIHRCYVFEKMYNRKTIQSAAIDNFESALIKLYALVLKGLAEADEFLRRSTPEQILSAIFEPTKSSSLLESLEKGEDRVDREAMACEAQRTLQIDAIVQNQLNSLLDLMKPVLRIDNNVNKVLQWIDKKELIKILSWISPIEYRRHHDTVQELRTKDTCDWLLQRPKFGQWINAASSVTLWLQGFPGSGKTYLTSRVIDEIEATLTGRANDESFAFFYCSRNEENRRNALDVLRSYVRQLSRTPQKLDFINPQLKDLYMKYKLTYSGWTLGSCQACLVNLLNLYPRTILILDALDECHPEERTNLLDFFNSVPRQTSKPVSIFISSRPEGDIRDCLIDLPNIEIQATDNEEDIAKFVSKSIETNGRWKIPLQRNQNLKDEVIQTLLIRSNGMFQWANLQIQQLLNERTEHGIRQRLGKLPRDLKAAYDEIYGNIETLSDHARDVSFRALWWITCAYQPLTDKALLAAVRVDPQKGISNSFETTEDDLLDWCANLIRIDAQQDPPVWRVSHLSVVEYLETRWTALEAHCFVAKASLALLQETYSDTREQATKSDDIFHPKHELQVYVQTHWIRHVQSQEDHAADPELIDLLKAFLGSLEESSAQYRGWHRQLVYDNFFGPSTSPFADIFKYRKVFPSTSTIILACCFSLYTLLHDWWDTASIDLSQPADSGDSLLSLAAAAGCNPICIKLCEAGMEVNMKLWTHDGSALAAAAAGGHTETVEVLVNKGADINMQLPKGNYGSALAAAAARGHTGTVEVLVNKGADINMRLQGGNYGSALAAAAYGQRTETVEFLINKGADINMQLQGYFGSALAAAAREGCTEIVQVLVDRGADINMQLQAGWYGSALTAAAAAYGRRTETVQFLIDKGADINMPLQAGLYGSALAAAAAASAAASGRDTEVVQSLIDKGADINIPLQTGNYGSALGASVVKREYNITRFLLEKGADFSSAIDAATARGLDDVVQRLVETRARGSISSSDDDEEWDDSWSDSS
ncbi:hypothetical protein F5Y14DRAFT_450409 [Nemania sp. NC0429]|nr:hypothetical protein F5Y14DRAFT_450409 [Nemania sp. NC0429]